MERVAKKKGFSEFQPMLSNKIPILKPLYRIKSLECWGILLTQLRVIPSLQARLQLKQGNCLSRLVTTIKVN